MILQLCFKIVCIVTLTHILSSNLIMLQKYCNAIIIKKTLRINKEIIKGITKQQKKKVIINREGNNIIMKLTQRKNIFFSWAKKIFIFSDLDVLWDLPFQTL